MEFYNKKRLIYVNEHCNALSFGHDSNYIVYSTSYTDKFYTVYEVVIKMLSNDGFFKKQNTKSCANSISVSNDGKRIAMGLQNGYVSIWNIDWTSNGKKDTIIESHLSDTHRFTSYTPVKLVKFSPKDSNIVVVGYNNNEFKIWNISENTWENFKLSENSKNKLTSISFSPDGKKIVSGSSNGNVQIWDISNINKPLVEISDQSSVNSVSFSFDGINIVSSSIDKPVKIWHADTGTLIKSMGEESCNAKSVSFNPNGTPLLLGTGPKSIRIWDFSSGELIENISHDYSVKYVSFSPNGMYIVFLSTFDIMILKKIIDINSYSTINKICSTNNKKQKKFILSIFSDYTNFSKYLLKNYSNNINKISINNLENFVILDKIDKFFPLIDFIEFKAMITYFKYSIPNKKKNLNNTRVFFLKIYKIIINKYVEFLEKHIRNKNMHSYKNNNITYLKKSIEDLKKYIEDLEIFNIN